GKPFAALLGSVDAQMDLGIAAIGGKDSMSGSFESLDVPPTLVSFATAIGDARKIASPEFKLPVSKVVWLAPERGADGLRPEPESLKNLYHAVESLIEQEEVLAAWTPAFGGIAEGLFKMCLGNKLGFALDATFPKEELFTSNYGGFILELAEDLDVGVPLGMTTASYCFTSGEEVIDLDALQAVYEGKLESVLPCNIYTTDEKVEKFTGAYKEYKAPGIRVAKPHVLIPVFPGTNCEYDTARAVNKAGGDAEIFIINNLSPAHVAQSVAAMKRSMERSQIIVLPGGFSGGDEPDGSGKFITAVFRNPAISEAVNELIKNRDGLILGICNGFQALIKLGLVPFGEIIDTDDACPTLTFNTIGRHQSKLIRARVASNKSPWLMHCNVDDVHTIAISHGEGRFVASEDLIRKLAANGQIATQYVGLDGEPSMDIRVCPNGSAYAIEGITSPDGRIFGKMGHSERSGEDVFRNVPGNKYQPLFEGGMDYFKL
ncbi:MAG: phosphoribosylformylglycinamidine synthase subunit PurQ, partial [Pygmaiobacter sp.]